MLTIATIGWLLSGAVGFFMNLEKIINFVEEIFVVTAKVSKYLFLAGTLVVHMLGGLISLGYAVYSFLKG